MDNPDVAREPVTLTLSADEALVLFELLASDDAAASVEIVHPAERQVLQNVLCQLERELVSPFDARYADILAAARSRLATLE